MDSTNPSITISLTPAEAAAVADALAAEAERYVDGWPTVRGVASRIETQLGAPNPALRVA